MSALEPGLEVVPGLTLLRPLGRGGMGEAWLARDAERAEEVVAKVLPRGAPPERVALLRREARLVRKLSHPRVVPVHGFRSGELGSVVTLAYMSGGDAGRLRQARPLEVVRLAGDVAEALDYLHGLGMVHRDVKPSNVLLDASGRGNLADFGIAATAAADEEGLVVRGGGSRTSMSPQQLAGQPAEPADDLYALGVLLFELLSGSPPFPREASDDEIRSRPAPAVSSTFPLPDSLRSLVARLLAKSAAERPPSAREVRDVLSRLELELGGTASPRSEPPVRLQPPPRVEADPVRAAGPGGAAARATCGREPSRGPRSRRRAVDAADRSRARRRGRGRLVAALGSAGPHVPIAGQPDSARAREPCPAVAFQVRCLGNATRGGRGRARRGRAAARAGASAAAGRGGRDCTVAGASRG